MPWPAGPEVLVGQQAGVAHVGVVLEVGLGVLAGVVPVGRLRDPAAGARQIVGGTEARHDGVRVHRGDVTGGVAVHHLEARAEVQRQPRPRRPAVVHVQRVGHDLEDGAAARQPVFDARHPRLEDRRHAALGVERRAAARDGIVRAEHVAGGGLRVAAHVAAGVVLEARLHVVGARAGRRQHPVQRSRGLPVVAVLGVGRVEVGGAVEAIGRNARHAAGPERRLEDVGFRAAGVARAEVAARHLNRGQRGAAQHAAIGRHPQVVRVLPVDHRRQLHRAADWRLVRGGAVVQVAALEGVVRRHRGRELVLAALVRGLGGEGDARLRQRRRRRRVLPAARGEEPHTILRNRPAEGPLVVLLHVLGAHDVGAGLERRFPGP